MIGKFKLTFLVLLLGAATACNQPTAITLSSGSSTSALTAPAQNAVSNNSTTSNSSSQSSSALTVKVMVTTFAGGSTGGDAIGTAAHFVLPQGLAVSDEGFLYVADTASYNLRRISPQAEVNTYAHSGNLMFPKFIPFLRTGSFFNYLRGVAVAKSGNVYVADTLNNVVRKIAVDGSVSNLGIPTTNSQGSQDGNITNATFAHPTAIFADASETVYTVEYDHVRKITTDGQVKTIAIVPNPVAYKNPKSGLMPYFVLMNAITVDSSGNIYVVDAHLRTVNKITQGGKVTIIAGSPGDPGSANGNGSAARFNTTNAMNSGIAIDQKGYIYVSDTNNHTIRRIAPNGDVITLAGKVGTPGKADGDAATARFWNPSALAIDKDGNLFVADFGTSLIRKIEFK